MSDAASAVRWLLDQAEPEARRIAVQQIPKVGGREAPDLLLRALGDEDWRVRKEATLTAPALARRDEVIAILIAALEETVNIGLRNAAVDALVAVGPDTVGATIDALGRFDADARKLAVEVLGGIADPRGTTALADLLSDEDANVNVAAAEALGGAALAGEEAREHATRGLVGVLGASSSFLKIAALESLGRLGARLPWATFEPFVADPLLRRYAISAASGSREAPAVRALAKATSDPSPTISRDALVALGDLLSGGPLDDALVVAAREALDAGGRDNARRAACDAEDARARGGALLVLGLLQDPADVPLLVQALGDDEVALRADMAVRLFGAPVVRALLAAARGAAAPLQVAALSLAASLDGADVAEVRSATRESLGSASVEVAACAVEVLGVVGDESDLRRAASLVGHSDERLAAAATDAVAELAARHVGAAQALLRESRPPYDPIVLGCILLGAVATIQPLRDDDVHLLERALEHDDPQVRRAAIEALAQSGGASAAAAVVFALSDEEREVQFAAVRALGRLRYAEPLVGIAAGARDPVLTAIGLRALGEADPQRAMQVAGPLVRHADPAIAYAAVEAAGQLAASDPTHAADREDILFAALDHGDEQVVKLALALIGAEPGARALVRLGLCLDHGSREVRCVAAELLAQDKSLAAQRLLRVRYEREKDPTVRAAIAHAVSVRSPSDLARSERAEPVTAPQGAKAG